MKVVALALRVVSLGLALVAVLGLGLKAKIMSLENWLNSFPIMICFLSFKVPYMQILV